MMKKLCMTFLNSLHITKGNGKLKLLVKSKLGDIELDTGFKVQSHIENLIKGLEGALYRIMKQILLTNDDGFDAVGLKALIEALEPLAKITVVAPAKINQRVDTL